MDKNYTVKRYPAERDFYTFTERNSKGELIEFEISKIIPDNKCKNSIPNLWYKYGMTKSVLPSYWSLHTYISKTIDGCETCKMIYNPTVTGHKLNFEWVLEATEENKQKLIDEVYRLANI